MTEKNDYIPIVGTLTGVVANFMPYIGQFYLAAASAHNEQLLRSLDEQLQKLQIDMEKLKAFMNTECGYRFFQEMIDATLKGSVGNKVKIFAELLKENLSSGNINVQYNTLVLRSIAELTSVELELLVLMMKYWRNTPEDRRYETGKYEVFLKSDNDPSKTCFGDYLKQYGGNGLKILEEYQFVYSI